MLNPTWLRVNLLVFFLIHGNDFTRMIEDHKASAGGSLVNCSNILSHF
jgi:hypothetical protein